MNKKTLKLLNYLALIAGIIAIALLVYGIIIALLQ